MRSVTIVLLCSALFASATARADGLSFSWIDASLASPHQNQGGSGHGSRLDVSYALSNQAFMYANGRRDSFDSVDQQFYRAGVGINSNPASGYVLFATVGWNNVGTTYPASAGMRQHGYDAGVGIRTLLTPKWEVYAAARYLHNDALTVHAEGSVGVFYALSSRVALGAGATVDAEQTGYLLSVRINY